MIEVSIKLMKEKNCSDGKIQSFLHNFECDCTSTKRLLFMNCCVDILFLFIQKNTIISNVPFEVAKQTLYTFYDRSWYTQSWKEISPNYTCMQYVYTFFMWNNIKALTGASIGIYISYSTVYRFDSVYYSKSMNAEWMKRRIVYRIIN